MTEQGAPMLVGTDAGVINTPFDETWPELVLMAQAGMTLLQALRAATLNAVMTLRVEPGALAGGIAP